ncbi:Double-strand break repair protein MRE11 [Gracilariopsis chorda]|uniref:Double-strand break repair protein MRE11 n=1 Tax=Gracilariopsis chorda TaxID=448386 RepID=A0A2V3INR2_9FLOR|nr:Double-strand break repair protein MRE11 [Gracilariopsis chorda]|eukprot:PXF43712.1 Double-strand break repair protein MRE11 [Gracilariopsis chorda]
MNPSVAVSLPVFIIHGNHDDPTGGTGLEALSAVDVLSEAGLVTYFGKMTTSKKIDVHPILLQKGHSKLALYGLGNVRDEVLYDTWAKQRNVRWLSPEEPERAQSPLAHQSDTDEDRMRWFNLFVLHQNRLTRGSSRGISDTLLPPWLDYVVWGHEHDSLPELSLSEPPIVQPGSTVATSLTHGESKPKHCILLEIYRGKLKHRPVPLFTVRNFEFEDIALSEQEELSETDPEGVQVFLKDRIKELVERQQAAFDIKLSSFQTGTSSEVVNNVRYPPRSWYIEKLTDNVRRPLIRLRVEITGNWDPPNPQRFGRDFVGKAASPNNILLFYRHKRRPLRRSTPFLRGQQGIPGDYEDGNEEDNEVFEEGGGTEHNAVQIPRLVQYYLYHHRAGGSGLKFLEMDKLSNAIDQFVNKDENKAILEYISSYLKVQQDKTLEQAMTCENAMSEEEMLKKFEEAAAEAANRALALSQDEGKSKGLDTKGKPSKDERNNSGPQAVKKKRTTTGEDELGLDSDAEPDDGDISVEKADTERDASKANGPEPILADLDDIDELIAANPRLARANAEMRMLKEKDDEMEIEPSPTASSRSRGGRSRGRGTRGRGRSSAAKRPPLQTTLPRTASQARPRRSTRRTISLAENSDNDEEVIAESPNDDVSEEHEASVPLSSTRSRKRKAASNASGSNVRSSARARTESAASGGSRRSAFANRTRLRRSIPTIDLDEESGDDAM